MGAIRVLGWCTLPCLFAIAVIAMLPACGGDDTAAPGGGGGSAKTPVPSFVDCWVEGLEYTCGTETGFTNAGGTFACGLGDNVEFYIGDIELGEGPAGPFMNPIEITGATDIFEYRPTNIARVLQTIDEDANPDNGIVITPEVRAAAVGQTLDFNQHPNAFASDANVQSVITALTTPLGAPRTLVEYTAARDHLRSSIFAVMAGNYSGSFDDEDSPYFEGDWIMVITNAGNITMTAVEDGDDPEDGIELTGMLQPDGSFECSNFGGVTALSFRGTIRRGSNGLHDVDGNWEQYMEDTGDFDGDRSSSDYPDAIVCP